MSISRFTTTENAATAIMFVRATERQAASGLTRSSMIGAGLPAERNDMKLIRRMIVHRRNAKWSRRPPCSGTPL